ncbi:hypothetical protein DL89DRAFT_169178 [Linderina pennispora]|uniref:Uncharacterized protein n=1 Tax=Linderina pennispora TaxID=61395 RepID=A0A1Y1W751_9FUNG|nr:uncharacterized protein DL89DRAFT_169178 [Linderina pennispora]ORX68994.1 hypothetical protein DL89DRAFT_169178 [Linderina pennispora]
MCTHRHCRHGAWPEQICCIFLSTHTVDRDPHNQHGAELEIKYGCASLRMLISGARSYLEKGHGVRSPYPLTFKAELSIRIGLPKTQNESLVTWIHRKSFGNQAVIPFRYNCVTPDIGEVIQGIYSACHPHGWDNSTTWLCTSFASFSWLTIVV